MGFLFLIVFSTVSDAAYDNYNSILLGDQAAGLGGAYTAMDDDVAALSWYNPAGLANMKGQSFSASVGIYKKYDVNFAEENDIVRASLRVNQGFFKPIPSATGSVVRFREFLPDYTFSFSILTPDYYSYKGAVSNTSDNSTNLYIQDESIWVGFSASKVLKAEDESLGISLFYTARSLSKTVTDKTFVNGLQTKIFTEERAITQNAVVGSIGYLKKLTDDFKLGILWRLPSLHVAGRASYSDAFVDNGSTTFSNNLPDLDSKSHIPSKLAVGLSWTDHERWVVSADLSGYEAVTYKDIEYDSIAEKIEHQYTINGALGIEYAFLSTLKLRMGWYTNLSSHPVPNPALVRGQGDRVDQLGFSSNIAFRSGPIQYTFGGYYTGGRGKSVQRIDQVYKEVPKTEQVFTMLFGTAYVFD